VKDMLSSSPNTNHIGARWGVPSGLMLATWTTRSVSISVLISCGVNAIAFLLLGIVSSVLFLSFRDT
jgi:hypothetical protein